MMPSIHSRASTAQHGRARRPAEPLQVPNAPRTIPGNTAATAELPAAPTDFVTRGHNGPKDAAPAQTASQKLLVTVPEVCRMLSIGRSLAYELIARGVIPSVRLGERRVLVPVAALQKRLTDLTARGIEQ